MPLKKKGQFKNCKVEPNDKGFRKIKKLFRG